MTSWLVVVPRTTQRSEFSVIEQRKPAVGHACQTIGHAADESVQLGNQPTGQANEDRDPGEVSGLEEHELAWAWQRKEAGF